MGHGIPTAKVQRAERNKIMQPHQIQLSTERPHPRATRQHKIPWRGLAVVIIMEKGLSEPVFYGDLVYKLKKIVGSNNFQRSSLTIISHYKKIGYNINVLQQTACLVVNPITFGNFTFLFNCTPVGRTSDSMTVPTFIQRLIY